MLTVVGLGHQDLDVLTTNVICGITENALRSRIERLDNALLIDGDDSVHNIFQDTADLFLAFLKVLISLLQLPDHLIEGHRNRANLIPSEHVDPVIEVATSQNLNTFLKLLDRPSDTPSNQD